MRLLLPEPDPAPELLDLYDSSDAYLRAGFVLSLDGAVAVDGSFKPLSAPADMAALRSLRAVSDVIVVGAGTARAEDYGPPRVRSEVAQWRTEHARAALPKLAVVTRTLDLEPTARLFTGEPPLLLTCSAAPKDRRDRLSSLAEVVDVGGDDVDPQLLVGALRARGLTRILCEGGPSLLQSLMRAGLVDELCVSVAPVLVGAAPHLLPQALPSPLALRLLHAVEDDGYLLLRYACEPAAVGRAGA